MWGIIRIHALDRSTGAHMVENYVDLNRIGLTRLWERLSECIDVHRIIDVPIRWWLETEKGDGNLFP